jgi:antirestriction protein ArdC
VGGIDRTLSLPTWYLATVFNAQQCELPARLQPFLAIDNAIGADASRQIAACEGILANMPHRPGIQHGEARAYYRPTTDTVNILNRDTLRDMLAFGDTNYSKEELVAEMGAAYLCGVAGIVNETVDNSAAYIQGWLGKLRNDKRLLVHAATQAQKAADWRISSSARRSKPAEGGKVGAASSRLLSALTFLLPFMKSLRAQLLSVARWQETRRGSPPFLEVLQ